MRGGGKQRHQEELMHRKGLERKEDDVGEDMAGLTANRDRDIQKQIQWNKTLRGNYNSSLYHQVLIARFEYGKEEKENEYWIEERSKLCRMCWI